MPTFGEPTYAGRSSSATFLDIVKPSDIQDDALLVAAFRSQDGSQAIPWSAPEGFVRISAAPELPSPGARVGAVWVKHIDDASSEPETYRFSGPTARAVGIMATMFDAPTGELMTVTGIPYGGSGAPVDGIGVMGDWPLSDAPSISIMAVGTEATSGKSGTPTETANFTRIGSAQSSLDESTIGSRTALWLGWRNEPTATLAGYNVGYQGLGSIGIYHGAFTGGTGADPIDPEPPVLIDGFRSVAQMLATPGATWAHRGGSKNWPEMSERAYTNAVQSGYGALEFSAARTSDGVWFGLHDASLNRTSETAGLPDASAMTWAEVQTHTNTLVSAGNPAPYYRLDDFLDAFGSKYVVILDPKYGMSYLDEFFELVAEHADRKRVVIKAFGPSFDGPNIATRVQDAGYSSWGYYYPAQVADGTMNSTQQSWSILGMDYSASQSDWDAVLSYGKPVVGHIATSMNSYHLSLDKGARMVQCADVVTITAVGPQKSSQIFDAAYAGGSRIPVKAVYSGSLSIWP